MTRSSRTSRTSTTGVRLALALLVGLGLPAIGATTVGAAPPPYAGNPAPPPYGGPPTPPSSPPRAEPPAPPPDGGAPPYAGVGRYVGGKVSPLRGARGDRDPLGSTGAAVAATSHRHVPGPAPVVVGLAVAGAMAGARVLRLGRER